MKNIIETLRDDNEYYNGAGREYLSASDIGNILEGTYEKHSTRDEWKIHFELGKLFHVQTLEPEKLDKFDIRDVERRSKGDRYIKTKEALNIANMKLSHDKHIEARGLLYGPSIHYEQPGITEIDGIAFKGKADCLNPLAGYVVDLKSTSNLEFFDESISKWYGPQLYVYWRIFNLPTAYIVVDKRSLECKVIYPTKNFYEYGKQLVSQAIEIYKRDYNV